jgi:hypothetical protein
VLLINVGGWDVTGKLLAGALARLLAAMSTIDWALRRRRVGRPTHVMARVMLTIVYFY